MKILIISYYFPPVNSIAALRPKSWAERWISKDHKIEIITRHWSGKEKNWNDFIASSPEKNIEKKVLKSGIIIHQLPYKKYEYHKNFILRKSKLLFHLIKKNFNPEIDTQQFEEYTSSLLKREKFDFFIVSSPPLNIIKLASSLHKKTQTPWLADFRDLENNTFLYNGKINVAEKLLLKFKLKSVTNQLSSCSAIVSVSKPINEYFGKKLKKKNREILNGFEMELLKKHNNKKNKKLTISTIGTLYPSQDVFLFLNALLKLDLKIQERIKVNFIGIKSLDEVYKKIHNALFHSQIETNYTEIIPREMAISIGESSDILYYPAWKGFRGIYSGKIFEYLALQKNILIAPGDEDVINELINKTNSGVIANSETEVLKQLKNWYAEWSKSGQLIYKSDKKTITHYSRENQADKLLGFIKSLEFLN